MTIHIQNVWQKHDFWNVISHDINAISLKLERTTVIPICDLLYYAYINLLCIIRIIHSGKTDEGPQETEKVPTLIKTCLN